MKRISSLLLTLVLVLSFILTSCGSETEEVRIIDFSDFTVNQIIIWSRTQNVSDKFDFYFDYNDTVEAGNFISSSLEVGEVIKDKVEIKISLGEKIMATGEYPYEPVEPYGPNSWEKIKNVMPNVIGMDAALAETAINAKGFKGDITRITVHSHEKKDTVLDCTPGVGTPLELYGGNVVLTVSDGALSDNAVNIDVPYSGDPAIASVYVNGEFKREFSKVIGYAVKGSNVVTVTGEGEATVKIVIEEISYADPDKNNAEFYFKVNFNNGTYIKTENPDEPLL